MVQCPDCESKDRITIAGKIFCANCGTPWVGSKQSSAAAATAAATAPAQVGSTMSAADSSYYASPQAAAPTAQIAAKPPVTAGKSEVKPPVEPAAPPSHPKTVQPILPSSPLDIAKPTPPAIQDKNESEPATSANAPPSASAVVRPSTDHKLAAAKINQSKSFSKFHDQPAFTGDLSSATTPAQKTPAAVQAAKPESTVPAVSAPAAPAPVQPLAQPAAVANVPTLSIPKKPAVSPTALPNLTPPAPVTPVPVANTTSITPPAPAVPAATAQVNPVPTPAPVLAATTPPAPVSDAVAAQEPDVEFTNLSKKEPSVLSDDQLRNLADIQTAPITEAVPVSVSTASNQMAQAAAMTPPTMAAPAAAAPLASPPTDTLSNTGRLQDVIMTPGGGPAAPAAALAAPTASPQSAAPAINGQYATVNGVTMSRDQALKLALNAETAPAQTGNYRVLKAAVVIILVLVVGGYVWQVNYPNLALKVAAARAGISAAAPSYVPSGWNITHHIESNSGSLQYSVQAPTNGQSFTVTQRKSDWDSQALLENYVVSQSGQYTTIQAQGLTIYTYNDNQATWVNRGCWFALNGSGSGLTQDELIKIATNL